MKSQKLKYLLLALVWCASSAGAYYFGRQSSASGKATTTANNHGKALSDHGTNIIMSTENHPVMTTKDLAQTKGRPNADALKAWADSLDPAECPGVLDDLQKMAGGEPRDAMMAAMIAAWAAKDPAGYLKDYSKVTDPRVRETGVGTALKAMAAKDPQAAIAFMASSTEGIPANMIAQRYRNAIQGMAANDPAAAFAFVQGIDNSPANALIQRQGLNAVADAMAASGNFTDALKLFSTLPDAQKATASGELMSQWAQLAPTDAAKYIATIDDPTQRSTAAAQVVRNWSRDDPAAAAAWAVQFDSASVDANGQPTTSGQALATAMRTWSRYDLDGPAQFLNTLTPSPQTDAAVATFAAQARNVDSSTALTWSAQITDPATRDKAIGSVAIRMLANGDNAALQKAISSNQISPDQVAWLQTLPTDNPQALNRMARRMGAGFTTNTNRPAPWAPVDPNAPAPAAGARGGAPGGAVGGPRAGGGVGPGGGGRGG